MLPTSKIIEELPKALPALLIPLVQYLWKKYSSRSDREKKSLGRLRLAELTGQRKALVEIGEIEGGEQVLLDLDVEIATEIKQLVALGGQHQGSPGLATRNLAVRWLLLYQPSGIASWVFHSLYWLAVAGGIIATLGVLRDDEIVSVGKAAIIEFTAMAWLPAIALRNAAYWVDIGKAWLPALTFWLGVTGTAFYILIPTILGYQPASKLTFNLTLQILTWFGKEYPRLVLGCICAFRAVQLSKKLNDFQLINRGCFCFGQWTYWMGTDNIFFFCCAHRERHVW